MLNIIFWLCLVFTTATLVYIKGIMIHEDMARQIEAYTESRAKVNLEKLLAENRLIKQSCIEMQTIDTKASSVFITLEDKKRNFHKQIAHHQAKSVNLDSYKLEVFSLSDTRAERIKDDQLRCA